MELREATAALLGRVEDRRRVVAEKIDPDTRRELGQFFTPVPLAVFIASLPRLSQSRRIRILDPGAGVGSLTAAFVSRVVQERPDLEIEVTAVEADVSIVDELKATMDDCRRLAKKTGSKFSAQIVSGDFLEWASCQYGALPGLVENHEFDIVIMNPPYRKINTASPERRALQRIGVEVSNLYVAFLALSASLLGAGGQIAAITPRSFANGPYFRSFRRFFLQHQQFERIHVFESRSRAFSEDEVLQENIVFLTRDVAQLPNDARVAISSSHGPSDRLAPSFEVPHSTVVDPKDSDSVVHILTDNEAMDLSKAFGGLSTRLADLNIEVSTGRVVDFRARPHLRATLDPGSVPLIYPGNLRDGGILWPGQLAKKPSAIQETESTASLLLPAATYVLVKRFSAKEEKRRVTASLFSRSDIPTSTVAFENHLNVFHSRCDGLNQGFARGLTLWLNSTFVDRYVRLFNGHTQINASDLRRLPYPTKDQLTALGSTRGDRPSQREIDDLVRRHVKGLGKLSV